jgi:uncharacterized protein (DUF697 family)/tellurite resistance protein
MPTQPQAISEQDHKAIICICIMAAMADGAQDDLERAQIERIIKGFSDPQLDLATAYQDVLTGKVSLAQVAAELQSPAAKTLAYEMAVCVCNADGVLKDTEQEFLNQLRQTPGLEPSTIDTHQQAVQAMVLQPLTAAVPPVLDVAREADVDRMILNAAILNGALEIMPHTLATMAIIPLQMRLVYNIGKRYGFELDRGHVTDFLATIGIGLTSQVFEGFTRRLVGGLARRVAGGLLGGLAGEAVGSAFAFATTYALGQVARRYYAGGRTLSTQQLKDTFASMLQEGRQLQGRYSGDIAQKARQVNVAQLLPLVRQ